MLLKLAQTINQYLSDYILIVLLIWVGRYCTVRARFVQVRCLYEGFRRLFSSMKLNGRTEKRGMSTFQALATAIAGQVGPAISSVPPAPFFGCGSSSYPTRWHSLPLENM